MLGGLFEAGINHIVGTSKAFVNLDHEFLMSDGFELIDPETLVLEVLETVKIDSKLIERLKYLRRLGYKIALDDFTDNYFDYPIVPLADIIKFDIMARPFYTIENDVKRALSQNKIVLAEKVETYEDFQRAIEMGI